MTQKLIIDADPGIIDALAILVAMADSSIELIGLTAVSGAVSGVQATRNLHFLTGLADPLKHPRVGQSDVAVCSADQIPPEMPHPQLLNGRFGLGDVDPQVPDLHNRRESAKLIVDLVREHPSDVRILTLGPLTNVAMALDLDPELPFILNGLICLGGAVDGVGDVTAAAEFNIWSDPQAARSVLRSPVGKLLVPLHISQEAGLSFDDIDRLSGLIPSTRLGELITGMLQFAARASRQHMPLEQVAIPAVAALAVACGAAKFTADSAVLDVEVAGELTNGMTVFDRRPLRPSQTTAEVIDELDHGTVIDYFCRGVRRIAMSSDPGFP